MYKPHSTASPYFGISGYIDNYSFPLPSMNGLGAMSTGELAVGAIALAGLWWFFKKHRR